MSERICPPARLRIKRRSKYSHHVLFAIVWPFAAMLVQARHFSNRPIAVGFVGFCILVGLVYTPQFGSDGHFYMLRFVEAQRERFNFSGEPIPAFLINSLAALDFDSRWYFASLGLIYGAVVTSAAKLLLRTSPAPVYWTIPAFIFVIALFANHPVFSALNARYHLGLWFIVLGVLLWFSDRRIAAGLVFIAAVFVHFGHMLFLAAFGFFFIGLYLWQFSIVFAYLLLFVAYVSPPALLPSLSQRLPVLLGGFEEASNKVAFHLGHAETRLLDFGESTALSESAWFLQWYTTPIFWSLLISGHYLMFRQGGVKENWFRNLWCLIISVWAMQFFAIGLVEGFSRLQRITMALLLLWHARWALENRPGTKKSLIINALPLLFYFVVAYRRWTSPVNIGAFMPIPFGLWRDVWPTVTELLGFR